MKKFYTLLAALCSFVALEAQDTFVFVDGQDNTIANGSTVTFDKADNLYLTVMNQVKIEDEGLSVKNVSASAASCQIKYEVLEITANTDFQICMAGGCTSSTTNGNTGTSNEAKNMEAGAKTTLLTHWAETSISSGSCKVKLTIVNTTTGKEEGSITAIYTYSTASVSNVNVEADEVESIYNLAGQSTATLTRGVNIVRYKSGRSVKVIKK